MKQIPPGRNGRPALTKDEIAAEFTHHALLFGVVPIYYNVHTRIYSVRNGWPRAYRPGGVVLAAPGAALPLLSAELLDPVR